MSGERSCTNSSSSGQVPTAKDNNRKSSMKTLFKLLAAEVPMHCMRQELELSEKSKNALTHKHSHTAGSREASLSRGNEKEKTLKQACFQGYPESAVYVQIPIGSRNSAIHNVYHTSLRPSSLFEPRHPSLKVVRQMEWREPLEKIQVSTNVKFKRHRQRSERGYDGPLSPHTLPASPCTGASTCREVSIPTQGLTEVRSHGLVGCVRMILPQVHLRKPCYDFSFL